MDIETNGLDDSTLVHSLCIKDIDTGKKFSYADQPDYMPISDGIRHLQEADEVMGHNIMDFDLPQLQRLRGLKLKADCKITDTLVITRLIWTTIEETDHRRAEKGKFPARLIGSHSLEAWGHRLGVHKGDFNAGKDANPDWSTWTPKMQSYCMQDVEVNDALRLRIEKENYSPQAIELEHKFRAVIRLMERHGILFNEQKAAALYGILVQRKQELTEELQRAFEPTVIEQKTPEYWTGYQEHIVPNEDGDPTKVPHLIRFPSKGAAQKAKATLIAPGPMKKKIIPFNPGSRTQIADRLMRRGWKPDKTTETGKPQVDESVLEGLDFPEAKLLGEYLLVEKRLGMLAEGKNAWMKLVQNGRIHGRVNTNGAVTGRCTHSSPNMAQVPSVALNKEGQLVYGRDGLWATECRELFGPDDGFVMVGADASGLELRCLAHYLGKWDGGAYGKVVLEGDVHTTNQLAFGLPPGKVYRPPAKNGIYAVVYGAGDWKFGITLFPPHLFGAMTDAQYKLKGAGARAKFKKAIPAFAKLTAAVKRAIETQGYLSGLDKRRLNIRSQHAALNTLLQSAGALIVKLGTVILYERLTAEGYVFGKDWALLLHIHDEVQMQARPAIAEYVGKVAVESFAEAGRRFGFRLPISGEWKTGADWSRTH